MAAEGGHEEIVTYLTSIESGIGIDIDIRDEKGVSMKYRNRREISI